MRKLRILILFLIPLAIMVSGCTTLIWDYEKGFMPRDYIIKSMTVRLPDGNSDLKIEFGEKGRVTEAFYNGTEINFSYDAEQCEIVGNGVPYNVVIIKRNSYCIIIYDGNGVPVYVCVPSGQCC